MSSDRDLFLRYLGHTSPHPGMTEVEKAEGVFIYGPDGKDYIDLISGVSVSNIGHRHPRVLEAIRAQTEKYLHVMVYGEMVQSPQVQFARLLAEQLPDPLDTVFLVNSGSEANEGALKLAKRCTGRTRIMSAHNAYHGSTAGALSITGHESLKYAFRPLLPDVHFLTFNREEELERIDKKTAAVILEPVQAEAGVLMPRGNYLQKVRQRCDDTGTLLIFDEVQTGFGRLGSLFASQHFGVTPDIITLAKSMGGGMPAGGFAASGALMQKLTFDPVLGHITTFGGHPVSAAAAKASLEVILEEGLARKALDKEQWVRQKLQHHAIKEIRGSGMLLAVRLHRHKVAQFVVRNAPQYGLLLDHFLFCDDAFRIAPPLTITSEEMDEVITRLNRLLNDAEKETSV